MRAALALVATLLVACSSPPPARHQWADESAHLVDGIWLGVERACGAPDVCQAEIDGGFFAAGTPDVVAASVAALPVGYVDDGRVILWTTGGMSQPVAVIFDLADGNRRVVLLSCVGPITDGKIVTEPRSCEPRDVAWVHEGREPWVVGGFQ